MRKLHTQCLTWILFFPCILFAKVRNIQSESAPNPICFIENKGQVTDDAGNSINDVLYIVKDDGLTIYVYRDGLSYQFNQTIVNNQNLNVDDDEALTDKTYENAERKTHRVNMKLIGAELNSNVIASEQLNYFENYYNIPSHPEGISHVNAFKKITIENVYPGINWIIYSINNKLKYDFEVMPGADASAIKMKINDADEVKLIENSIVRISTSLGEIIDSKLFCYEKESGIKIESEFLLKNDIITFNTAAHDHLNTLIIDPELAWSTYYGGEDEDAGNGIALDHEGNILITGYTSSEINMAVAGFAITYYGGFYDVYVAKFDETGTRLWSTYYGGTKGDYGTEICVNSLNQIYATGYSFSNNFVTTPGAFQEGNNGSYDSYLIKLNPDGTREWATLIGGNADDFQRGISLDVDENIYMVGTTYSSVGLSYNGYQNIKGGLADQYLIKFTPAGSRVWCTYYGGALDDFSRAVTVDQNSNVFITGYTESLNQIAYNAFDSTWAGKNDCSLAKYDSSGLLLWSTYFGGSADENGNGVATDINGDVYMAVQSGTTNGLAFDGYKNIGGGGADAMLVKFSGSGNRLWATYYGGSLEDMGKAICVNGNYVYLVGHAYSTSNIAEYGFQNENAGQDDAFIDKFDLDGIFYWCSYTGGSGIEYGRSVVAKDDYTIFFTGKSFSPNFPTTAGAHQETFGGYESDAFLQRINDCPDAIIYYADTDGDGFGNHFSSVLSCVPVPAYVLNSDDCNDANAFVYPASVEICNSLDDNCDGLTDDADPLVTGQPIWYVDADADNFGDDAFTISACLQPVGYAATNSDCDESNNLIHPGAAELCNLFDDDCDAIIDEDIIYITYYSDADGDGFGNNAFPLTACDGVPTGYVLSNNDCNDANVLIHPGGFEICNSLDDNCNVLIDDNVVIATATALGPTTFCKGSNVILQASAGAGYTYQWKKNASNIVGATSQNYTVTQTANYSVVVSITGGCSATSSQIIVTVNSKPNPSITPLGSLDICATGNVKLKTAAKTGDTYQWYKNGIIITTATSNIYTANAVGSYYVKQTNIYGCFKNSASVYVISSCKNGEVVASEKIELQIFPNPARNNIVINLNLHSDINEIGLINILNDLGQLIKYSSAEINSGLLSMEFNLPNSISDGIYLVQVITSHGIYSEQAMLKRN